jgi:hypothetical protein
MSSELDPGHRFPEERRDDRDRWLDDRRSPSDGRGDPEDEGGLDAGRLAWLLLGAGAIAAGTALGWDSTALAALVTPPSLIRAALVGLATAIGLVLLLGAIDRLGGGQDDRAGRPGSRPGRAGPGSARDIATMIRGVRLVFLAVAAFAAASGWLLGHPLPLVIALVIAGVDVLETSFLLLVVSLRSRP